MRNVATLTVREVMRRRVTQLSPDDTIESALRLFEESSISGAPVVDLSERLVGVLSLSDVARSEHLDGDRVATQRGDYAMSEPVGEELLDELDPEEVFTLKEDYSPEILGRERVADWMTTDVVTIAPGASVAEACRRMIERQIHRVFVVEGGRLVGLLSSFDVVRAVAGMTPGARG